LKISHAISAEEITKVGIKPSCKNKKGPCLSEVVEVIDVVSHEVGGGCQLEAAY